MSNRCPLTHIHIRSRSSVSHFAFFRFIVQGRHKGSAAMPRHVVFAFAIVSSACFLLSRLFVVFSFVSFMWYCRTSRIAYMEVLPCDTHSTRARPPRRETGARGAKHGRTQVPSDRGAQRRSLHPARSDLRFSFLILWIFSLCPKSESCSSYSNVYPQNRVLVHGNDGDDERR